MAVERFHEHLTLGTEVEEGEVCLTGLLKPEVVVVVVEEEEEVVAGAWYLNLKKSRMEAAVVEVVEQDL